ncbi:glucose 1-dehydrogenase [Microbacterium aoyamense]|uniref:Glucose 1-dehydrogenase n=1 Tax=Microbacterium aoyamense TaxID=344166 RepID=A0ABP5B4X0_9MICO|nr:SDR family oxidoreductase [Microbacterium aoyamense]
MAIVTGAGAGLGLGMTVRLLDEGAHVVAGDLDTSRLDRLRHPNLISLPGDVTDPTTADALVSAALDIGTGRIDALFNNAGIALFAPAEELENAQWDRVIAVNLSACWYVASAVGRVMIAQRGGAILNTASGAGLAAVTDGLAYVASKHGVVGLTRSLAVDWGRYGIRVNALAPGFTSTGMTESFREQAPDLYAARASRVPLGGRAGTIDEQVAMALFLNSDEASYTTGLIAVVDGGTHALSAGYSPRPPVAL